MPMVTLGIMDRLGLRRRSPTRIGLEARPAQQQRRPVYNLGCEVIVK
jgi:hypothetical protein